MYIYLAKLKNVSIEKLVSTTTNNFLSLFDKFSQKICQPPSEKSVLRKIAEV